MCYRWIHSSIGEFCGPGERQDRCLNYILACYNHFQSHFVKKCSEEGSSSWTRQKLPAMLSLVLTYVWFLQAEW